MRYLRHLFDFYINASIHVALAVCALTLLTIHEFDVSAPDSLLWVVFFGTVSGYNFIKYAKIAGLHHRSLAKSLKTIQLFSFLCTGLLLFYLFELPKTYYGLLTILALVTLFYAVPFLRNKSLRTLFGLKIFVVAVVWAGVAVLFPLWDTDWIRETDVWLTFSQIFILVIAWTLPFEIRDLPFDGKHLGTLPQKLGVTGAKIVGIVLILLAVMLEGFKDSLSLPHFFSLFVIGIGSALLLGFAQKKQPRYFASFVVESIPIVWVLCDNALRRLFG